MKIAVTGATGTVGTVLVQKLQAEKHTVLPWDRSVVPVSDYWAMENFLRTNGVQVLYHLAVPSVPTGMTNEGWVVNYQWTSELAWLCKVLDIKFIYISTVMVFSSNRQGPFTIQTPADAADGYGMEKRMAEERVFYQNANSTVIRLGWQIGGPAGSNNMVDFLDKKFETEGLVPCSTQWIPACSFLEDTVGILTSLIGRDPGLYQFDSNERWSFYQIAFALNKVFKKSWKITATDNFVFDQRMIDDRLPLVSLKSRLTSLKA